MKNGSVILEDEEGKAVRAIPDTTTTLPVTEEEERQFRKEQETEESSDGVTTVVTPHKTVPMFNPTIFPMGLSSEEQGDLARAFFRPILGTGQLIQDIGSAVLSSNQEQSFYPREKQAEEYKEKRQELINKISPSLTNTLIDPETGEIRPPETGLGAGMHLFSYVLGGGLLLRSLPSALLNTKTGQVASFMASEGALSQILENPDENMAKLIVDITQSDNPVLNYLASDKDDPALLNRAKLFVESSLIAAGLAIAIGGPIKAIGYAANKTGASQKITEVWQRIFGGSSIDINARSQKVHGKNLDELDEEELNEVTEDILRETKKAEEGKPSPIIEGVRAVQQDNEKGVAQVLADQKRWRTPGSSMTPIELNPMRLLDRLRSRGYLTQRGYQAQELAIYAEKALKLRANHIAKRLDNAVKELAKKSSDQGLEDKINISLTDSAIAELSREGQLKVLTETLGSKDIANEVLNARNLIDELSKTLVDSNATSEATREVIANNIGEYLGRFYRFYEDPNFVPDAKQIEVVRSLIVDSKLSSKFMDEEGNLLISQGDAEWEQVFREADQELDELLNRENLKEYSDYISKVAAFNERYLKGRKDIDIEIRKLFGEVTNPSETIILTVNKLAKLTTSHRFYQTILELGGSTPRNPKLYNEMLNKARIELKNVEVDEVKEGAFVLTSDNSVAQVLKNNGDGTFNISVKRADGSAKQLKNQLFDENKGDSLFGEGDITLIPNKDAVTLRANDYYKQAFEDGGFEDTPYTVSQYIFDGVSAFPKGKAAYLKHKKVFNTKIEGTGTVLDGQLTTPEMARALHNLEDTIIWGQSALKNNVLGRPLTKIKGYSQNMHTIWDHTTHLRNGWGSFQWGAANGMNPMYAGERSFALLRNEIAERGDEALDDYFEKMSRLGVIGTDIRAREIGQMLELRPTENPQTFFGKLESIAENYNIKERPISSIAGQTVKGVKYLNKKAEQIYTAWDDYFKLNAFEYELAILKQAKKADKGFMPNATLEDLEVAAAEKVKRTMQNYDRVPKVLRSLNQLPIGNYVSFPAEVIRTSGNIILESVDEILSGNPILRERGMQRLAGYATVSALWSTTGYGGYGVTKSLFSGEDPEVQEARQTLYEHYSPEHNKIFIGDDDYRLVSDPTFLNSFGYFQEVARGAYQAAALGELEGKTIERQVFDATVAGLGEMFKPFTEESMYLTSLREIGVALADDQGRTTEGRKIFQSKYPDDIIDGTLEHLAKTFAPGVLQDGKKMWEAFFETKNPITGKPRSQLGIFMEMTTGINFRLADDKDQFRRHIGNYLTNSVYAMNKPEIEWEGNIEDYEKSYYRNEAQRFKASIEFYRHIKSMQTLGYDYLEIWELMEERGLKNQTEIANLINGVFTPKPITEEALWDVKLKFNNTTEEIESSIDRMTERFNFMNKTISLEHMDDYRKENIQSILREYNPESSWYPLTPSTEGTFGIGRRGEAEGGEIDLENPVLQVPDNPSERINKITGEPYSDTAGFEDPLKLLGFAGGGQVDPLARLGFSKGSVVDPITLHHLNNLKNRTYVTDKDGYIKTVFTTQVEDRRLNNGLPTLIPTIWNKKELSVPDAIEEAVNSKITWPSASTHEKLRQKDIEIHKGFDQDLENYGIVPNRTGKVVGGVVRALAKQAAKRAGRNVEAYHGTLAQDIDEFKVAPRDFGIHVGTAKQASTRVEDVITRDRMESVNFNRKREAEYIEKQIERHQETLRTLEKNKDNVSPKTFDAVRKTIEELTDEVNKLNQDLPIEDFATGANILPLYVKAENPLRLHDIGAWDDPRKVITELLKNHNFKSKEDKKILNDFMRRTGSAVVPSFDDVAKAPEDVIELPKALKLVDDVKNFIKSKGFDSIVYKNRYESHINDSNKDSYIIFDPKDIRARSAEFDPAKADSPRLLDATGGQVLGRLKRRVPVVGGGALKTLFLLGKRNAKAAVENLTNQLDEAATAPYEFVPKPATREEMFGALKESKKEGQPGQRDKINVDIPEGTKVGLRLDIPAYTEHNVWVPTLKPLKGSDKTSSHRATAAITNPDLSVSEALQKKALKVKEGGPKSPFAVIKGSLVNRTDEENYRLAQQYLTDPEWTQVGYNPKKHSYFFDRKTGQPVIGGEEAIQVGPLVLVKKAKFGKREDYKYVMGGKVLTASRRLANAI